MSLWSGSGRLRGVFRAKDYTRSMPGAGARILRAAVGFALVSPTEPDLRVLHRWMDCWRGISDVTAGGLTTFHGPAAPDRGSPPYQASPAGLA
jgi:hypothetical protein